MKIYHQITYRIKKYKAIIISALQRSILAFSRFDISLLKMKNPTKPLQILTYDGGNQSMHPKMLYFKDGWNGYRFWLATSPFKSWSKQIENPCIYHSNDGINFECISDNPLDAIEGDPEKTYNSDPHLVYNYETDCLECWWRYHTTQKSGQLSETIFRRCSADGKTWTEKEELFCSVGTEVGCISPAIIFENQKYKIWVSHSIHDNRKNRTIRYYESDSGSDWQHIRDIMIPCSTHDLSHLDVIHTEKGYEMIVQGIDKVSVKADTLFYSCSQDNVIFSPAKPILKRGSFGSWDDYMLYRPSLTKVDDRYYLYYGAASTTHGGNDWATGLIIFSDIQELLKHF